ncbi:MAG: hypothetical protein OQK25_03810 [Gammaproteobacteria bacterium]|nr:hypothetical protein [Gammaproteobacteria bacterium]MCW8982477.1 hypothetical protein [Gammaproteobacteria bacterium]
MIDPREVQRLKRRYDLRAAGAELRDMVDDYQFMSGTRAMLLNDATHKMAKKDRLFFRQGYLFQAGVNNG